MRRNQVIYNRNLSHNVSGWYGYHISKRGRLYRYYPKRKLWMVMKGTISRGRTYHILRSTNKRVRIQASRLVAMAWIPNPENKPFVCHKDNVPTNNHYKNLYWGTQKENMEQCIKDKRLRPQGKIPISKSQIRELNQDYQSGYSLRELVEKYNITHIYRYLYPDTNRKNKKKNENKESKSSKR